MLNFPLILRAFRRDWQNGELTLLALALIVAVTCISALNNFSFLVNSLLNQQATQMLGADVIVTSNAPIPTNWEDKAKALTLSQGKTISFLSMVTASNDNLQLAQISAIATPYPLKGYTKIASHTSSSPTSVNQAPALGQVWVEARLLPLLAVNVGDPITIGAASFIINGLIIEEPGQTGDWFNISPRILMNQADLAKTQVIQPGSRVSYQWLLVGPDRQLEQLKKSLTPPLTEQQRWVDRTTNPALVKAIERTITYLNLGTLMSLTLAGIAISMATHRYSQRHQQHVAILRCFGASERDILIVYLGNILLLGCLASLIGVLLGYLFQPFLVYWLRGLLPHFNNVFNFKPALLSFITGVLVLVAFTLTHLLTLRQITAITLFKQQQNLNSNNLLSYTLSFLLLLGLAYLYTHSWQLISVVFIGLIYFVILALGMLMLSILVINLIKYKISFIWRFGFTHIERNLTNSLLQLIGIGLALAAFLTLNLFKMNLVEHWQEQLPADAPNFFVINIQPSQTSELINFLHKNQVKKPTLYPIVRGRLTTINSLSATKKLGDKAKEINALQRELNFSWSTQLPEENKIIAGSWLTPKPTWISIEDGLARQLGVTIGDELGFRIGEQIITAPITSIRQVNWTNFKPNFFILFNPTLLANLPQTYLTSFYLPETEQNKLLDLARQFPNITIIDIARTIKKVQDILSNVSKAITLITLFSLLIGIIIAILSMLSFDDIKQKETYVLKLLGMQKKSLFWIRSSESFIIGFYAGLLAIILALFINYYLNTVILGLTFHIPWLLVIIVPVITTLASILINYKIMKTQYAK
ncbi:lipoprotein releasing system, transmembrane protein, LolC/E family [Legionella beliardensis]|uniref:Lipoprotein releasing system, transmembrane protein, LolC/E family n=1 Tax=Legionella beliardensis TaxID=91822 RepID=A0A378HXF4_9GAMM|nr:FtsX-like permease family protein [Legionella beliardensis]STX27559.1 lipoprotein releasing system, transmembrane protein, LolC/E family [Legionella beliardensis]